ncbi:BcNRPS1, nonribosomal peptide synthetase [Xylariaceae sp. AK1471]|nr:BcNRPS1, nonribosomal peptide synthetase [Xylariaceae sp. AK1471]
MDVFLQEIELELRVPAQQLDLSSSFIRNGGDSLSALRIVSSCRSRGISITVAMLMSCGSIHGLVDDLRHQCRNGDFDNQYEYSPTNDTTTTIAKANPINAHPLKPQATHMQLSLIHGSKAVLGGNIIRYYETYATEHIPRVRSAWETLVSQEPIFRTAFQIIDEEYRLFEGTKSTFDWEEVTAVDRATYLSIQRDHDFNTDFIGSTFRVVHQDWSTESRESTVVWNIHHALIDGYSGALLLNKHRSLLAGNPIESAPSFVQFIEHASTLDILSDSADHDFWMTQKAKLESTKSDLNLPPSELLYNPVYARRDVHLKVSQDDLYQFSKTCGVTVASFFYAAWALTLSRYVDSNHICFGVVLSGRSVPLMGVDAVIGPLIHTVPFQVSVNPNENIPNFLMSVFKHSIELDDKQWSMPQNGLPKSFPSILNIHFVEPPLNDNPLGLLQDPQSVLISNLPLSVEIHLGGDIQILFHEHLFRARDIERIARVFADVVDALVDHNHTIGECWEGLLNRDATQLWTNSNCSLASTTIEAYNETLVDLFDRTATDIPEQVALEKGSETITYSQLLMKTTAVGRFLSQHILPGDVVCVHADRTINWIITIYGILKAGGVYCPLDAALPCNVRNQNFSQSGSSIFLVSRDPDKTYKPLLCQMCFSIDEILGKDLPVLNLEMNNGEAGAAPNVDADAYLCFTSGSTGKPKGVLCTHRGLVAFQKDFDVRLRSRPGWRIAQVMSPAFDGSIHELFSALSYGSTLILQSSPDPFEHLSRVDAAILTPSIAGILHPDDLPSLRVLYLVGEAVSPRVCDKWAGRVATFNMYGPTEATCGATIKELKFDQPVTLGKPNPSTRLYVLDHQQRMTPLGVIGEVYLAGVQVSRGYINQLEETARKFQVDCIVTGLGERMYRTGDRGYWDEQGDLRFCGRNDRQIKLRGFRIDLDDIEVRIRNALHGCTDVAVACDDGDLIAQLKPSHLDITRVRERLLEVLPGYAVPRRIAAVSEFPHTNAGKLDYHAIKASNTVGAYTVLSARNHALQDQVSAAWREVLQRQDIILTSESNFLELGGHSLLQLQLANKLSSLLGYPIPLAPIIQSPTLGDLVDSLAKIALIDDIGYKRENGSYCATPIEDSWWRRYQFCGGSSCFNVALCFELGLEVEMERLSAAWNQVLKRHLSLRCRFSVMPDGSVQRKFLETFTRVKLSKTIDLRMAMNRPFDLEHDYLIRITLTPDILVVVAHHIICDYTALNVMLHEASCTYRGVKLGEPVQISDRSTRQPTSTDVDFWKKNLRDVPFPSYSVGEKWKRRKSYSGSSHLCRIKKSKFLKLDHFMSSRRVTAHQLSLAAVAVALQHHSESIDIVLGAPHLGRSGHDTHNVVGLFLEPLAVRITYPTRVNLVTPQCTPDFLHEVRECSQKALSHAIPMNEVLEALGTTDDLPDNPLFDVMVSYHESFGKLGIPGVDAKPLYTWTEGSKFKLMVEFVAVNDTCLLVRLEYSDECFSTREIGILGKLITCAFEMLVDDAPLTRIRESLARVSFHDVQPFYGVRLDDL